MDKFTTKSASKMTIECLCAWNSQPLQW